MADRYFTPGEVQALIPTLTVIMDDVMAANAEASAVREEFAAEEHRISMSGGGMIDPDLWRQGRADLERIGTRIQARLEEVAQLGGVIKDVGMGLVDFPHLRNGEIVNLCWKHGETAIEYWHGLDEGFARRKPL